ncbi:MAG: hypothetical protein R3D67_00370 [Hyphomicrobiaceae bacterium]
MRRTGTTDTSAALSGITDWTDGAKPVRKRDWKRSFLVVGLGLLSWVATYVGLLELIEANMGDLPLLHKVIIGFSVAMLMVMVVWLLDQIFSDIGWTTRMIYVGGYVFLTLISVGFGFGFYWKVLESRGESSRSAESAVGQVQNSLHAAVTRLEQLQATLDALTTVSVEKAQLERTRGTSCPNSRPGDGPRRQLRDDDASRFKFASDFVKGRVGVIKTELGRLNGDIRKVVSADQSTFNAASGTRNEFMRGLNQRLDMTVTGFNAFRSDPQLKQVRADLADRSTRTTFPDTKGGTFACPDQQLTTALRGVVRAIDELPVIDKPKIAAVEGSEAVIEAFRRLGASAYGALSLKLPPTPEELRDLQKKAVQSVESSAASQIRAAVNLQGSGLSRRDYIPLAIAVFVDLCLLLVSIKRPASPLDRLVPKMRDAEQGPVIQILSRFNEIHKDHEIRENFEVFRHVVFDYHGDYYAAVPLNTPYRPNPRNDRQRQGYGVSDAEQLMQEAHLLSNLFASFEKERIFSRVMNPLLSTSIIQKRLRRQGSKFANAGAFRVYRFRDGAWSEIILGAVMGAAKRVEAEKRRRQLDEPRHDEAFAVTGHTSQHKEPPDLGAVRPDIATRTPNAHQADHSSEPARQFRARYQPAAPRGQPRGGFTPHVVADNAPVEPTLRTPDAPSAKAATEIASNERDPARDRSQHAAEPPARPENVVVLPASPRASTPPMAPRDMDPIGEDEAEPERGQDEHTETLLPQNGRPGRKSGPESVVTVAATREHITYSVPSGDPRLPHAKWTLSRDDLHEPVAAIAEKENGAPERDPALPPPLPTAEFTLAPEADDSIEPPAALAASSQDQADDVFDLARRFGPATREG